MGLVLDTDTLSGCVLAWVFLHTFSFSWAELSSLHRRRSWEFSGWERSVCC